MEYKPYALIALITVSGGLGSGLAIASYDSRGLVSKLYTGLSAASFVSTGLAALTLREELRPERRSSITGEKED